VVWVATAWVAISPFLLDIARMAWTETPFIAVILGMLLLLEGLTERDSILPTLFGVVLLCWTAFLLRYAGLATIPAAALAVLWTRRQRLVQAVGITAAVTAASIAVPAFWMLRNRARDGSSLGPRQRSSLAIGDVAGQLKRTLVRWLLPFGPAALRTSLALLLVVTFLALVGLAIKRGMTNGPLAPTELTTIAPIVIFGVVYGIYMVVAELRTTLDPIDSRLLSPLYVPGIVLVAIGVQMILALRPSTLRSFARIVSMVFAAYVLGHAVISIAHTRLAYRDGVGYASRAVQSSGLAQAVRGLSEVSMVATNSEGALYELWAVARKEPLRQLPSTDLAPLAAEVRCARAPAYLAWFGARADRPSSTDAVTLAAVYDRGDGALYRMSVPASAGSCSTR